VIGDRVSNGDGDKVWTEICVDSTGRTYLIHDSEIDPGLFFSYGDGDQLVTETLDDGYDGVTALTARYGPMCGPTDSIGVQVVYELGAQIVHRTIGAPLP
jgi:hypothetical protein